MAAHLEATVDIQKFRESITPVVLETVQAKAQLALYPELVAELRNIASAKPSTWGDQSDQFKEWAQNRCRFLLERAEAIERGE